MGRAGIGEIDTPSKRGRLEPRKNPYWHGVSGGRGGVSLGYRRPESGAGSWIAKIVVDGKRHEERIGTADDDGVSPGAAVMNFRVATKAALDWASQRYARIQARLESASAEGGPTVRSALETYSRVRKRKSVTTGKNAEGRLALHVLSDGEFAETPLAKLSARSIEAWRERLPVRKVDDELRALPLLNSDSAAAEEERASIAPATVNRLMNDLRAALNAAAEKHRRELPAHILAEIRIGTRALHLVKSSARKQLLTDVEILSIVDAAYKVNDAGDFGRLILLAAATGARYSQLTAMLVGDVQVSRSRLLVTGSGKGRSARVKPPASVPVSPDVIARLQPALVNRPSRDALLLRWAFRNVGPFKWERDRRRPWGPAYETDKLWKATVAAAGLPPTTVMYALRHSSIVRGLSAGVPVRLVAALHDTSIEMIEAHYSAYITEATEEIAKRGMLVL